MVISGSCRRVLCTVQCDATACSPGWRFAGTPRRHDAQLDGADSRGPVGGHGELGHHLQPAAVQAVPGQVAAA